MNDSCDPLRTLARELKTALVHYHATSGGVRCAPGCPCPLNPVIDAVEALVDAVAAYDAGGIVPTGIPIAGDE